MVKVRDRPTFPSVILGIIIILLSFYCFIAILYYETRTATLIRISSGKVSGFVVKRLEKTINCYFGIPYAEPPINELRFRKPVPKKPWKGLLKAVKLPSQCMQQTSKSLNQMGGQFLKYFINFNEIIRKAINSSESKFDESPNMSEDCLYLNVFVNSDLDMKSNRPVMLWIHGGGFVYGNGTSYALYDGSILAAFADVIVVTINYRLGLFGFLSANHLDLGGNYGIYDQIMALKWVKDNIKPFGGNPDNIVIFGESAGAMSVGFHLISKLSKNLFKRAILQSGNAINMLSIRGKDNLNKGAIDVIQGVSCPLPAKKDINTTQKISSLSLSCLRKVNASDLLELELRLNKKFIQFLPSEDKNLFGGHPYDSVKEHRFSTKTEIIIGSNSDEGAMFAIKGPLKKFWSFNGISPNFTRDNILNTLEAITKHNLPLASTAVETAVETAFEDIEDRNDSVRHWYRYIKRITDMVFVCPDYVFINEYSAYGGKVYYYQFSVKSTIEKLLTPKWIKGATHTSEILFVFGIPLITGKLFTKEEIQLSKSIMSGWTQLAINGIPKLGKDSWLQYKEDDPSYLSIELGNSSLKKGFPGLKCDEYYEELYAQLRSASTDETQFQSLTNSTSFEQIV